MYVRNFQRALHNRLRQKAIPIQVLIGGRGVGKTTAAQWIYEQWKGKKLWVNADTDKLHDPDWLMFHVHQAQTLGPQSLLVVDELHRVREWPVVLEAMAELIPKVLLLSSVDLRMTPKFQIVNSNLTVAAH